MRLINIQVYFKYTKFYLSVSSIEMLDELQFSFPDVNVLTFAGTNAALKFFDSKAVTFTFDTSINNIAAALVGNDINPPPTTPAGSHNYKFQVILQCH